MKKTQIYTIILLLAIINSCSVSNKMLASVGGGCLAGLAAGAIYDATQDKKSADDRKKLQNQIGSIFKKKKAAPENKGKIIGLGVGCLAGLGVGYYLDTMAEDMEENMKKSGINVRKIKDEKGETKELLIRAGEKALTFKTDSAELLPESEPKVKEIAEALKGYPETQIRISGHVSDSKASNEFKEKLSGERATAIKSKLSSQGVPSEKIYEAKGKSVLEPLEGTKANDPSNRRVEVYVKADES
ncbi:MAG: OmpA family protein [Leptospiraceae bacterium]|nr:OmpA family protein [Leptospiraceae bacterium]